MQSQVIATGILFAEGPVWCGDGTVVTTSVAAGALVRVHVDTGAVKQIAVTTGGPNGAALAEDGSILVTQNGGIDFSALPLDIEFPPTVHAAPGLQLARLDGTVTYLADGGFHGPNDLAVTEVGDVFFTDPGHYPPATEDGGRVMVLALDGSVSEYARGFQYCNGIVFDLDGHVVVVERSGLQRVFADGTREWVVEKLGPGGGDGFCIDEDGHYYVASTVEHGIRVIDTDGKELDFLAIDGKGMTTNCCFGGDDLTTLYVTDALPGNLVAFEGMPTPGLPLPAWPGLT